jgi:hypothetical protein
MWMTVVNVDFSPYLRPHHDLPLETVFREQKAEHPLGGDKQRVDIWKDV